MVFITGRGGGGFSHARLRLYNGLGAYVSGNPRHAAFRGPPVLFRLMDPCLLLYIVDRDPFGVWVERGPERQSVTECRKGSPAQAVELVRAGKRARCPRFSAPVCPITNTEQPAAHEKHSQSYHVDIVRSLGVCATAEPGSHKQSAFNEEYNLDEDDSEYESDSELEFEDQRGYNQIDNERQDDSEVEDTLEPLACGHRFHQEIISGTGSALQDVVIDTEWNLATACDPWSTAKISSSL